MLPAPFYTEVPHDLGHDAAWWGRDLMQALLRLRRHQPTDHSTDHSTDHLPEPADDHHTPTPPTAAPFHPRDCRAKSAPGRGRLEHA